MAGVFITKNPVYATAVFEWQVCCLRGVLYSA